MGPIANPVSAGLVADYSTCLDHCVVADVGYPNTASQHQGHHVLDSGHLMCNSTCPEHYSIEDTLHSNLAPTCAAARALHTALQLMLPVSTPVVNIQKSQCSALGCNRLGVGPSPQTSTEHGIARPPTSKLPWDVAGWGGFLFPTSTEHGIACPPTSRSP